MSQRKSGILLHPTSLPGKYGIGDLGRGAYRFVDYLAESGQRLWQILPLGPPGYGNSPYQCFSSIAGNPLLISPEVLADQNLLSGSDLERMPDFPSSFVDFGAVIPFKQKILRAAAKAFFKKGGRELLTEFERFCEENKSWLEPFSAFAALKEANGGVSWTEWQRRSNPEPEEIGRQKFFQFEFFRQWTALKSYCNNRGIELIGDLPIFIAHDSADVWANPELFDLAENGTPRTIAGVPPDYFSETGQCWGNPLYRWDVMEQSGYRWWIERIRAMLMMVDLIRLDHFRGFEKYYEIPGGAKTAEVGRWIDGPGDRLFAAIQTALGELPFIAEDLGLITADVHELRDRWGFPGMRVLQFAFGNETSSDPFKPYNFVRNCVVYTGTHDNDTTCGWFHSQGAGDSTRTPEQVESERAFVLRYLNTNGEEIHWDLIRLALASVADTVLFPMQDVLGLGSEARMNRPASAENNWRWRMEEKHLKPEWSLRLRQLCQTYGRLSD